MAIVSFYTSYFTVITCDILIGGANMLLFLEALICIYVGGATALAYVLFFFDHLHCTPLICCWQKGEKYLGSYMILLPLSIVLYLLYICLIIWWMFVITKKGEIDGSLFWWWLTNHPCGTNRVFWVCYTYIKQLCYNW